MMDKKQKPPTEEDIAVWIQSEQLEQVMRENPELFDVDNLYLPQTVKELERMKKKIGWQQGNMNTDRLKQFNKKRKENQK